MTKSGPNFDPQSGPIFRGRTPQTAREAVAFWRWNNCLEGHVTEGKIITHLNFDESSMRVWMPPRVGYLVRSGDGAHAQAREHEQEVTLAQQRTAFSFLAVIADNAEIQAALPQWFLVNFHTLSARDAHTIAGRIRETRVRLVRAKSAWATQDTLADWLRAVGQSLRPWRETHVFILSMDSAPVHITTRIARIAAGNGLRLCIIPPNMTRWLQPLDTHAFQHVKRAGRDALESLQLSTPTGRTHVREVLQTWATVVHVTVTQRNWNAAFLACGVGGRQRFLGQRLRRALQLPDAVQCGCDVPSLDDLQTCSSHRNRLPLAWWFNWARADAGTTGAIIAPASVIASPFPELRIEVGASTTREPLAAGAVSASSTDPCRPMMPTSSPRRSTPRARPLWGLRRRR